MRVALKHGMRGDDHAFLRAEVRDEKLKRPRSFVRIVDLFAGCGGLTLGVAEAARARGIGLDVRLAVERDPRVAAVYARNFGVPAKRMRAEVAECFGRATGRSRLSRAEEEVVELVGPAVDILVGGPPCQGHSTLNNHTRGDDPKNRLYLSMVRATEVLRPAVVMVENVPAVERDRGDVVGRAKRAFTKLGYVVDDEVVCVADLGVPQLRKRHVLVATRGTRLSLRDAFTRHACEHRSLRWAIGDLVMAHESPLDQPGVLTQENLERARYLLQHRLFDLPNHQRPPCQRGAHKYKSMYGRLEWDAPAQTITTGFRSPGQGRYLHPEKPRTITPHEAARIQFFPDWFDFSGLGRTDLARAIGNAVPPKLGFVVASEFVDFDAVAARRGLDPQLDLALLA